MDTSKLLQTIEGAMHEAVDSDVTILRDASRHILGAGGKRIRPRLMVLAYAAAGGRDIERAVPVAAAIEMVHTASMVHDDINDHGTIRRGRPSVNAIWGRTFALLTGDFLFARACELMAPYREFNIILAETTSTLVEGESLQAEAARSGELTRERYLNIIERKTAALFRAGTRMGALLAGADAGRCELLANFGFKVGMAFQITDDILDLVGDDTRLGKSSGNDLTQGKGIAAVGGSNGTGEHSPVSLAEDPLARVRQKILAGDAIEKARAQAGALVQQAVASLDTLPPSPERAELASLAQLAIERDH